MAPIEKNVIVVDEQGNQYEATYPKRARGLVKHGRARFIGEHKICLACPPKMNLEDHEMTENNYFPEPAAETAEKMPQAPVQTFSMGYVLEQIEKIAGQTAYLNNAIAELGELRADGPGDGKAQAIADVVRCRETTNQQLLKLYEKTYDDTRAVSGIASKFDEIGTWLKSQNRDEYPPEAFGALLEAAKAQ